MSPQRKLSVIPEVSRMTNRCNQPQVPGFSRPPSLAELGVGRQKREEELLEIIVSGSKQEQEVVYSTSSGQTGFYDPMVCLPAMERIHQHSIESSIVTEGHYDASFETEDFPTGVDSFDIAYNEERGRNSSKNSNSGHVKGSATTSNGMPSSLHQAPAKPARMHLDTNGGEDAKEKEKSQVAISTSSATQVQPVQPKSIAIQSIPSEVELVREGEGQNGEVTLQPQQAGKSFLWKRVRHCVVFGVKKKEEK